MVGKEPSKPQDEPLVNPSEDPMFGVILGALKNHTLTYTCTDDDERFPLVDKLIPPRSKDIKLANEELEMIAESVWFALSELMGRKP